MNDQHPMPKPTRAMVNVTGRCNSRCVYCRAWIDNNGENDPTCEELCSLMDQVADIGCHAVGYSGGEPLLRTDLETIISRAAQRGLSVNLTTNGLLLTEKRLHSLAEAGLDSLSVSLDSIDPATYASIRGVPLAKVMNNLTNAAALGLMPLGISTTVSARNVASLDELVAFAKKHGLLIGFQLYEADVHLAKAEDSLCPDPVELSQAVERLLAIKSDGAPITSSDEYLKSMVSHVESGQWAGVERCVAPSTEICVDESLQVQTCWGADNVVGNLREHSLAEIWGGQTFDALRRKLAKCRKCILSCHFDNSLRVLASARGEHA